MKASLAILLLLPMGLALWIRQADSQRGESSPAVREARLIPGQRPAHDLPAMRRQADVASVSSSPSAALAPAVAAMLHLIASAPDSDHQSEAVKALTESLAEADLLPTLNALAHSDIAGPGVELRQLLLRRWAALSPDLAATWAASLTVPALRSELLSQVAIVWAESDWDQAVRWARTLPADKVQSATLVALGFEAARSQPVEAIRLAIELPAGQGRDQLLEHAARQWSVVDGQAAVTWAARLPDGALRETLLAAIGTACAEQWPVEAAMLSVGQLTAPELQEQAVVSIVQRWAQTDPASTAAWVTQFPAGPVRDGCVRNLVEIWAAADPTSVAEWLGNLPAGLVRDPALAAFACAVAPFDLSVSLGWTDAVEDPECRARSRQAILRLRDSDTEQ